jgi:hypothetical protein
MKRLTLALVMLFFVGSAFAQGGQSSGTQSKQDDKAHRRHHPHRHEHRPGANR